MEPSNKSGGGFHAYLTGKRCSSCVSNVRLKPVDVNLKYFRASEILRVVMT
jgi:hypothetical protein